MKNRDRYITKVNPCDMLCDMQKNTMKTGCVCVLDQLTGKMQPCPKEMNGRVGNESKLAVCRTCIQKWMNEEEKI